MSPIERLLSDESGLSDGATELATPAIDAFLSARTVATEALNGLGPFEGTNGVIFHTLRNLFGRIEEQAEGMLVCFASGCPAAAETIARTVVETSVNFMYIAQGDCGKRVFSYFRIYLSEHGTKLDYWTEFVKKECTSEDAGRITQMIEDARKALDSMRSFAEQLANECGFPDVPSSVDWPRRIFDRFKATSETESYWTIYHRLSAATHGNAEETIRWLVGMYHVLDSGDDRM